MKAVPSIKTTCKDCVFAEYSESEDKLDPPLLYQVGCRMGRIDRFRSLGIQLNIKEYEENRWAYEIIGRVCMAARKGIWGSGLTSTQQEAKIREELRFTCHVYVPALKATPEDIEKTLESLVLQQPQAAVTEVLIQGRTRPGPLIMRLKDRFDERLNWKLTVVNAEEIDPLVAIDHAVHHCKSPFYAVFNAGSEASDDFLGRLDRAVNEELLSFAAVPGDQEGNGLVVVTQMHQHLGGNEPVDMVEGDPEEMTDEELENANTTTVVGVLAKIRFLTERCGVQNLILEDEALCQK